MDDENSSKADERGHVHDNPAKNAGKLRKKLHIHCAHGNLKETRQILIELYDSSDSPLEHADNTPEKFSAIVEGAALALCSSNEFLAEEMVQNIEYLHRSFGISEEEKSKVINALREFATNVKGSHASFVDAQAQLASVLQNKTNFKNIKLMRYFDKFPQAFA